MSKGKFDLSNIGGQPKDWLQREHEKEVASSSIDGWKVFLSIALALSLLIAGIWLIASDLLF